MALYRYKRGEVEGFFLAERDILDEFIIKHAGEEGSLTWTDLEFISSEDTIINFLTKYDMIKGHNPLKN